MDPSPATPHAEHPDSVVLPTPVEIVGVPVHPVSMGDLLRCLIVWGRGPEQRRVFHVNVHAMNVAARDHAFRVALGRADLVVCDGFGVKLAAPLAGRRIPHRMTSPDWIDEFARRTAVAGQSVFALGDEEGIASRFQAMLASRHSGYRDAGSHHGFFDKEGAENDEVVDAINRSGADHLLVGFGMPVQELWIERNADRLAPRVLLPVGALYRWYTGADRRAPGWMTDHGMEWLARFVRHPRRHFRRYAIGNPAFLLRLVRWRLGLYHIPTSGDAPDRTADESSAEM